MVTIHSHTYINTVTTTFCEAHAQLLQNLESNFSVEGTRGRGSKPEYPENPPPPDSLPANQHHILKEKIQRPRWESNPQPSNIGDKLVGQERAPRLIHWATDRRCFCQHSCPTLRGDIMRWNRTDCLFCLTSTPASTKHQFRFLPIARYTTCTVKFARATTKIDYCKGTSRMSTTSSWLSLIS